MASDDDLIYYFHGLRCGALPKRCNGKHVHLTGKEASEARVWPWDFARRMSWGIVRLLKRKYWQERLKLGRGHTEIPAYPVDATTDSI